MIGHFARNAWPRGRNWLTNAGRVLRRIIGAPDYDGYVAHMRARHPDRPVLSPNEFARMCLHDRYSRPGSRCC